MQTFKLFFDALAQQKYTQEVSFIIIYFLYAFLDFESSKSGPKNVNSE